MGLYSRDYYREIDPNPWGFGGAPVVKWVVIVNVVVFVLQIFVTRPPTLTPDDLKARIEAKDAPPTPEEAVQLFRGLQRTSVVQEWLELDVPKVVYQGQVWRLLTHAFCHDRMWVLHILFNMILLYWFGRTVEIMYGSREFLLFYLAAALAAALAYVALDLYTGSPLPAVGASGAVMGVMMVYTVHFPREEIFYCWFFPMQMRWWMALWCVYDLHPVLLALSGDRLHSGVGHAAHLGGLAFGFVYAWYEWRLEPLLAFLPARRAPAAAPRPRPAARPAAAAAAADPDAGRLDEVLEKISRSGQESLTDADRAVLRAASERLKRTRGG